MTKWKVSAELIITSMRELDEKEKALATLALEEHLNMTAVYNTATDAIHLRVHIKDEIRM